ncbi:MAG: Nif3-like dinuclear metal center hexameric protein [Zoogloeaceae bacterium]|jgi:dinuclear metal center YbgI/SA1388 family protein|nr:Nif3-like dinuclear metal center hexameric protein [Zoogloeaceae bacterium]
MRHRELESLLDALLERARFTDYSPNGLQVEGRAEIRRVVVGVSASQALIDAAAEWGADALIVHHGFFWKGEDPCLVGYRRRRIAALIAHDINLFAYHLPLDAHPELGNNAQWAKAMGWRVLGRFGRQDAGFWGETPEPCRLAELAARLTSVLERPPLVIGAEDRRVQRIAWCSGGAQGYIEDALALAETIGIDAYLSGEISEQTPHVARENHIAYLACGHHASERFGPRALAAWLQTTASLDCKFIDCPNPA